VQCDVADDARPHALEERASVDDWRRGLDETDQDSLALQSTSVPSISSAIGSTR
jgi:hypothetical protein